MRTMKAIICTEYGSPQSLQLGEIPRPVPKDGELLVKVQASSVNFANLALVRGKPLLVRSGYGLFKPRIAIPGGDFAGIVEQSGGKGTGFRPGDDVFGDMADSGFGSWAEYVIVPERILAPKPANLSFIEAAAVPQAAMVALQALRDHGRIRSGHKVMICGASGGIGSFAVQIAKFFGAEVTAVCSGGNFELVRSLGADELIDYTREDFLLGSRRFDLIVACAGYRSIFAYRRSLRPAGRYVATGGKMKQVFEALLLGPLVSLFGRRKTGSMLQRINAVDLLFLKELCEAGKIRPLIEKCYPLSEAPAALDHYSRGRTRGKIALSMEELS